VRIAQIAPLYESVPPQCYGGTERVVSYLTEALVDLGHDVTLFASGDSITSATLVPMRERSLRTDPDCADHMAPHMLMIDRVLRCAGDFDVLHWHVDYLHYAASRWVDRPRLTTLHGRLDLPELPAMYDAFPNEPVVSISDSQRAPLPRANWIDTVYHGLPPDLLRAGDGSGGYFAFVGRISPEKRVDRAIAIASALGVPLKIAAKIDKADQEYFDREIASLFSNPLVEFLGELGDPEKGALVGAAKALLFPIDWPEPFGLVMIESMACGTPVIAYRHGSVPEVMTDGVTGFVVDSDEEAIEAAARVGELDRRLVRETFDARFSARVMAENYVRVYERLAGASLHAKATAA
jgi:glycosyltransferase involved in cell wall biosynthesis